MKSYKLSRWLFLSVRMSFLDLQPKHVNYTSQFIILSADLWVLTCEWTCEWTAGLLTGCQQLPWGLMSWQELHPTLRTNVMLTISPLPTPIAHQLCVCVYVQQYQLPSKICEKQVCDMYDCICIQYVGVYTFETHSNSWVCMERVCGERISNGLNEEHSCHLTRQLCH